MGMAPRSKARVRKSPASERVARGVLMAARRKELGLSQQQVAGSLGVTQSAVAQWEAGKSIPTLDKVGAVAALLGIAVAELVPAHVMNLLPSHVEAA